MLHDRRREPERGLVEHHQLRRAHQAAADRQHLLLAARKRAGRLAQALLQARKHRQHTVAVLVAVRLRARQHRAHVEVFGDSQCGKHLAALRHLPDAEIAHLVARQPRNVAAAVADRTARRAVHARDGADQRGLAGAVRADDRDDRPLLHLERYAVERLGVAVEHVDVLDAEHHSASAPR
jgi:hypothetical protein